MNKVRLLLASLYLYLIMLIRGDEMIDFFMKGKENTLYLNFVAGCLLLVVILSLLTIKEALQLYRQGKYNELRQGMKLIKIGLIPFFLGEYFLFLALAFGFSIAALFFFWTIGGPIALMVLLGLVACVVYLTLAISSIYGIVFVSLLRKEKLINTPLLVIYIVLQLIPVVDVIITIVLLSLYKEKSGMDVE